MTPRRLWIAWEIQRRSISLSRLLEAQLFILDLDHLGLRRYPTALWRTAGLLLKSRGAIVFVQNPSMVLAVFATFWRRPLGYVLVVDRHSNFYQDAQSVGGWKRRVLLWMSRYSIARANLTIVTNEEVNNEYIRGIGRGFVLPDPYPHVDVPEPNGQKHASAELRVLFVASWETDEPIREVMEACRTLGGQVRVFISGKIKAAYVNLLERRPENFVPTGFLSDEEYFKLMASVDCVIAISTRAGTLCCGAYEGVAMGKPVILNDEAITKEYFRSGAIYTDSTVEDIRAKLIFVSEHIRQLTTDVGEFYLESAREWDHRLDALNRTLDELYAHET